MAETITLRAYLDEVAALLESESVNEVISHCRYILQHQPHNVEAYRLLGKALLQKGHFEGSTELFNEASEVFRRVLSVQPTDYIAHLGMSEVSQQTGKVDQAIWHLERAYEQQPGNMLLQDALRQLYVSRDGEARAPRKIQLTRAALARQYASGRLYDQALIELRTALEKSPDRIDLEVLLAETLWDSQHYADAGEVAGRVLKKLPECLPAQRILAQLWLYYQRPADAQPYLRRLEALDPYLAAQLLRPDESVPDAIRLQRLDYGAHTAAAFSSATPDWLHELDNLGGAELTMDAAMQAPVPPPSASLWPPPSGPNTIDTAAVFGGDTSGIVNWSNDRVDDVRGPDMSEVFSELGDSRDVSPKTPDWWTDTATPENEVPSTMPEDTVPDWFADLGASDASTVTGTNEDELPDLGAFLADIQGVGQMDEWLEPRDSDDLFPEMDDLVGGSSAEETPAGSPDAVPVQSAFSEEDWLPADETGPVQLDSAESGALEGLDNLFASLEDAGSQQIPEDELPGNADWLFMQDESNAEIGGSPDADVSPPASAHEWMADVGAFLGNIDSESPSEQPASEVEADFDALFGAAEPVAEQVEDVAAVLDDLGGLFEQGEQPAREVEADFDALFGAAEPVADQVEDVAATLNDLGGIFEQGEQPASEVEADFDALFGAAEPVADQVEDVAAALDDLGGLFEQGEELPVEAQIEPDAVSLGTPWDEVKESEGYDQGDDLSQAFEVGTEEEWHSQSETLGADIEEFDALFGGTLTGADQADVPSGFTELLQGVSEERGELADSVLPDVSAIAPPEWISASLSETADDVGGPEEYEAVDQPVETEYSPIDMLSDEHNANLWSEVEEDEGAGDLLISLHDVTDSSSDADLLDEMLSPDRAITENHQVVEEHESDQAQAEFADYSSARLGWLGQDDTVSFDELPEAVGDNDWLGTFAKLESVPGDQLPGDVFGNVDELPLGSGLEEPEPGDGLADQWLSSMPDLQLESVEESPISPLDSASYEEGAAQDEGVYDDKAMEEAALNRVPDWSSAQDEFEENAPVGSDALSDSVDDMLYQPYDPFEGGSADNVPEYQSAGKTGVLQPNEVPSWMAAFSDDQTLLTDENEEVASVSLHDLDLGFDEDEKTDEGEQVSSVELEVAAPVEEQPEGITPIEEEIEEPVEGEMPGWLAEITSSASAELDESLFAVEETELLAPDLVAPVEAEAALFGEIEEETDWPVDEREPADADWAAASKEQEIQVEPEWLAHAREVAPGDMSVMEDSHAEDELNALFDEFDSAEPVQSPMLEDERYSSSSELPWLAAEETPLEMAAETYLPEGSAVNDELDALFDEFDQSTPENELSFDARVDDHAGLGFEENGVSPVAEADNLAHTRDVKPDETALDESGWSVTDDDAFADDEIESEDFSFDDVVPVWLRTPKENDTSTEAQSSTSPIQDMPEWLRNALEDDEGDGTE